MARKKKITVEDQLSQGIELVEASFSIKGDLYKIGGLRKEKLVRGVVEKFLKKYSKNQKFIDVSGNEDYIFFLGSRVKEPELEKKDLIEKILNCIK